MIDDEKAERSRRYPSAALRDAIGMLESVYRGVGMNGGSRETIAQALGHQSLNGSSKRKIAALLQYALLEKDGDRYRISELGRRILIPVSEQERIEATVEAVRRPTLFQSIGATYDQERLPSMLANVIAREHKVLPQASANVATIFAESVEFAGLLHDGVLDWSGIPRHDTTDDGLASVHAPVTSAPVRPNATAGRSPVHAVSGAATVSPHDSYQEYSIALDSRGKKAMIHLQIPVTQRDLDRMAAWVVYMRNVVEDEGPDASLS